MWIPHKDDINKNKHYHYNNANNTKAEEPRDIRNIAELLKGLKTITILKF
jgi:hypothetical protein